MDGLDCFWGWGAHWCPCSPSPTVVCSPGPVPSTGQSPAPHTLLPWERSFSITPLHTGGERGPEGGSKWLYPQGCSAEKLEGQPSHAPASPARDSLSPEGALFCLPSHSLVPEFDDGLFFLALKVLLVDQEGESSWRDRR